jgi:hypothetical protein
LSPNCRSKFIVRNFGFHTLAMDDTVYGWSVSSAFSIPLAQVLRTLGLLSQYGLYNISGKWAKQCSIKRSFSQFPRILSCLFPEFDISVWSSHDLVTRLCNLSYTFIPFAIDLELFNLTTRLLCIAV